MSFFFWSVGALCVIVFLASLAGLTLLPDGLELARRVSTGIQERYHVQVDVADVSWALFPRPVVTLHAIHSHQTPAIDIESVRIRPRLSLALLRGQVAIGSIDVDGARIPTAALRAFRRPPGETTGPTRVSVRRIHARNLTWISRTGTELPLEADVLLDSDFRPARAEVWRPDFAPATRLLLERDGNADRWFANVDLGGGGARGELVLHSRDGWLSVTGSLAPRKIDVELAAKGLNRRTAIGGLARGVTRVGARGRTPGELGSSLRLRSELVVDRGELLRIDLDRAIRTLGRERSGRTPLTGVTGVMDVQNTEQGTLIFFREASATGETFTATLEGAVFNRQVSARGEIRTLGDKLVVPFALTGPTRKVKVTIPDEVKTGAIAGTFVLPVIGTLLGARIGAKLAEESGELPLPPGAPRVALTPLRP